MNRLKELRKEKGLTQQELADIMGVTRRGYQKWEKGESTMKSDNAQKLANFFGVEVSYLLGYSKTPKIDIAKIIEHVKNDKDSTMSDFFINQTTDIFTHLGYKIEDIKPHLDEVYKNELLPLPDYQGKTSKEHEKYKKTLLYTYLDGLGRFLGSDVKFFIKYLTLSKRDSETVKALVDTLLKK
ncbi:helix-turn-helix domain-containing protein [Streptococcus hyointestinalis]|uniref:helix-turn-helix domain-containing protein n=1 Tax=Streptococcus hyointestinalis TaxID=1337 RepID=UPI003D06E3D4